MIIVLAKIRFDKLGLRALVPLGEKSGARFLV